jgi:hypothetical protein
MIGESPTCAHECELCMCICIATAHGPVDIDHRHAYACARAPVRARARAPLHDAAFVERDRQGHAFNFAELELVKH